MECLYLAPPAQATFFLDLNPNPSSCARHAPLWEATLNLCGGFSFGSWYRIIAARRLCPATSFKTAGDAAPEVSRTPQYHSTSSGFLLDNCIAIVRLRSPTIPRVKSAHEIRSRRVPRLFHTFMCMRILLCTVYMQIRSALRLLIHHASCSKFELLASVSVDTPTSLPVHALP